MEEILERGQTWLSTNFDLELKLFFALSSPCVHTVRLKYLKKFHILD